MPDPLSLPPAAAARLAAGERARVWVEAVAPNHSLPGSTWEFEISGEQLIYVARRGRAKSIALVQPPAARGDRVKVACPECAGEGCWDCHHNGSFVARVLADPVPGRWCEECEGDSPASVLRCHTCHNSPPWGWWLDLQIETEEDDGN